MKAIALIIAALLAQPATEPNVFDRPMGELRGEKTAGPLDRMSMNQMMRMTSLPDARMNELKCAGIANWPGSSAWPVFDLTASQRAELVDRVAAALAHDVEMPKEIAVGLIEAFSSEPPYREEKGELPAFRAEMEKDCAGLIAQVRSGDYKLAPQANRSVVDPTLATCYARYMIAAEGAKTEEEAASLRSTASKAEQLALAKKQGDALNEAKAALAEEVAANRARKAGSDEDDMMRLVVCLPAIDAAKLAQAAK